MVVSSSDEKLIKSEEPSLKTSIIPNCVGDEMIADKLVEKDLKSPTIFFQGNFFWLQNVEAAKYIIFPKADNAIYLPAVSTEKKCFTKIIVLRIFSCFPFITFVTRRTIYIKSYFFIIH